LVQARQAADVVIMHNGDRMTGDLIRQDGDRLKLKTAYAGTLDIDWKQVREVRLDAPREVLLDDERVLKVEAVSREDDRLTLVQASPSAPITVVPARVKVIEPEPWELGEGYRLNGRLGLALKNERGNNDKNEVDLDFELDYRRRWHRWQSWGQLEYDTQSGSKTTDKWSLDNNFRRLFDSPWYASAWLFFKHDRFDDLRLRFLTGPALGYSFAEGPTRNLRAEVGAFYVNDDFYDDDDEPILGAGLVHRLRPARLARASAALPQAVRRHRRRRLGQQALALLDRHPHTAVRRLRRQPSSTRSTTRASARSRSDPPTPRFGSSSGTSGDGSRRPTSPKAIAYS
jgi:hypothetical protein